MAGIFVVLSIWWGSLREPAQHAEKAGALSGTPVHACAKYSPGANLEYDRYKKLLEAVGDGDKVSVRAVEALDDAAEVESLQALYEVFANAKDKEGTQVFYAGYSKPGEREESKDGGHGFRVVWQRTVKDDRGKKRLISVITFWDYKDGAFRMLDGPDSLRVRAQIAPDSDEHKYGLFHAHSFSTTVEKGAVSAVTRGDYFTREGKRKEGIPYQTHPKECAGCHYPGSQTRFDGDVPSTKEWNNDLRELRVDEAKLTAENVWGIKELLETIPKAKQTPALLESFQKPRETFFPKGILEALDKRCKKAVEIALARKGHGGDGAKSSASSGSKR